MSGSPEWLERRRLLVAQATLQRVRLAHQVSTLRSGLPAASAGSVLALALGAVLAVWRLRAGGVSRSPLLRALRVGAGQAWRAWRCDRHD